MRMAWSGSIVLLDIFSSSMFTLSNSFGPIVFVLSASIYVASWSKERTAHKCDKPTERCHVREIHIISHDKRKIRG